jgi:hypothetical protein
MEWRGELGRGGKAHRQCDDKGKTKTDGSAHELSSASYSTRGSSPRGDCFAEVDGTIDGIDDRRCHIRRIHEVTGRLTQNGVFIPPGVAAMIRAFVRAP